MGTRNLHVGIMLLTAAITLSQCSGGGGGGGNGAVPGDGTNPPPARTTVRGFITGFGSVFVNGVEYDSSAAAVTIDDVAGAESGLRIGMEVTLKGSGTSADSITAADSLEGPITSIDLVAHSFAVLGQTVQTDMLTIFENTTDVTTLTAGSIVEVSGSTDSAGVIHATRVELKSAAPPSSTSIEVKGVVSGLNSGAKTFTLGSLTVDYAGAELKDFPADGLADGQSVEVKSTVGQYAAGTGTLTAVSIEFEPGLEAAENEHVELKGYVTGFVSIADFKVNGVAVDASGAGVTGIANDVKVEVEGTINANGVLVASSVELEQESNAGLEGDVTEINASAGTVLLFGKTVTVTATTEFKDSGPARLASLSLTNLAVSDHVEVAGYVDSGKGFIATRLERLEPSSQAVIQGVVTAKAGDLSSLSILDITVPTDAGAKYKDRSGASMSAAQFFSALTVDATVVKAQWDTFTSLAAPADEFELESGS